MRGNKSGPRPKSARDEMAALKFGLPAEKKGSEGLKDRPFEGLKKLLEARASCRKRSSGAEGGSGPAAKRHDPAAGAQAGKEELPQDPDAQLFLKAMEGVRPLEGRFDPKGASQQQRTGAARTPDDSCEGRQVVEALRELVAGRGRVPVEKTPEYVQGPGINDNPQVVRKLRRGKYAVQAYCDLHGLTALQAQEVCHEFMEDSLSEGRRCIAFIHGRGLSSRREPVLKRVVTEFLVKGRFRRWVLAYSSAPAWDGGPGVTYVLLRKRPVRRRRAGFSARPAR